MRLRTLQKICLVVTIIGGILWLCIGLFDMNFVARMFDSTAIPRVIYTIVGITSLINIGLLFDRGAEIKE